MWYTTMVDVFLIPRGRPACSLWKKHLAGTSTCQLWECFWMLVFTSRFVQLFVEEITLCFMFVFHDRFYSCAGCAEKQEEELRLLRIWPCRCWFFPRNLDAHIPSGEKGSGYFIIVHTPEIGLLAGCKHGWRLKGMIISDLNYPRKYGILMTYF